MRGAWSGYAGGGAKLRLRLGMQGRVGVMNPPLPVPEPLMLLLVAYLAWSLELD